MLSQEQLKRLAAEKAVEFVPDNEYIGIGTGSTVNEFIKALAVSGKHIKGAVSTRKPLRNCWPKWAFPRCSSTKCRAWRCMWTVLMR